MKGTPPLCKPCEVQSVANPLPKPCLKVASSLDLLQPASDVGERRKEFAEELNDVMHWTRTLRSLAAARRAGLLV